MELRGKQKRFLRSEAHHLTPIFQIGKGGLNEAMIKSNRRSARKKRIDQGYLYCKIPTKWRRTLLQQSVKRFNARLFKSLDA